MTSKKFMGVVLSVALALPANATTTTAGTIRGMISMAGQGLEGLPLMLVNVETGKQFAVRSAADGSFTTMVPAGSYVFSSPGRSGVSISRAPLSVDVVSGKVASANVEVAAYGMQDTAGPAGTTKISHDGKDCILEGEFTLIEAIFEPLPSVLDARLYFQSNLSPEWFYTVFERIDPAVPGGPTHRAFIPRVSQDGGIESITYYLQATTAAFEESKSSENVVKVVAEEGDCEGEMAPIGTPPGAVSVLSASGASAGSIAGFGGVAGGAILGGAAIAGVVAGLAGGGLLINEVVSDDATPTPTVVPPVTTTPTATPTATPAVALCRLTVTTTPVAPGPPDVGGDFCAAGVVTSEGVNLGSVVGTQSFGNIPCTAGVTITGFAAPQSSILGALPATWSGACGGSALGAPCVIGQMSFDRDVTLTCSTS